MNDILQYWQYQKRYKGSLLSSSGNGFFQAANTTIQKVQRRLILHTVAGKSISLFMNVNSVAIPGIRLIRNTILRVSMAGCGNFKMLWISATKRTRLARLSTGQCGLKIHVFCLVTWSIGIRDIFGQDLRAFITDK